MTEAATDIYRSRRGDNAAWTDFLVSSYAPLLHAVSQ